MMISVPAPADDSRVGGRRARRRPAATAGQGRPTAPWNVWMLAVTTGIAIVAAADGIAIITGAAHLDPATLRAVPGNSPVLLGIGVLLAVALPMASAAYAVHQKSPSAGVDVVVAGAGLIGWTVIMVEATGSIGWLPVLAFVTGALVALVAAVHTWSAPPSTLDGSPL
ncbi:hypothetical protein ACXVUM_16615 [Williamsia sp. SKLECPSW1]